MVNRLFKYKHEASLDKSLSEIVQMWKYSRPLSVYLNQAKYCFLWINPYLKEAAFSGKMRLPATRQTHSVHAKRAKIISSSCECDKACKVHRYHTIQGQN